MSAQRVADYKGCLASRSEHEAETAAPTLTTRAARVPQQPARATGRRAAAPPRRAWPAGPGVARRAGSLCRGATPDARLLVGGQGEIEARRLRFALPAHCLGRLDLLDRRAGGANGKEQIRIGVPAR